jgi:PAS domain S-box-containing protein
MSMSLVEVRALADAVPGRDFPALLQLHERAVEAATTGITISDCRLPDHPLIFANDAFLRMTGYRADEVLGRNCRFLQGAEGAQPALAPLRAALRAGRDCLVLLRNYRRDGTLFWNELAISPVHDAAGLLTHYIGIQSDVTARVRAEEGLREANDELERRIAARTADLAAANTALLAAQYETLDRLARAAESRDDDTGQHTQRVGRTAALLARALGCPEDGVQRIERAAILHDVGKIGIPDEILLKPARLTSAEFARMQTHTTAGAAILAGPQERALAELQAQAGRQFDPRVVAAFCAMFERGVV